MKLVVIAAVSENFIIGKNGSIPWDIPGELNFFKVTTTGYPVIMGRKTFQSLKGALKNRLNIVVSCSKRQLADNSESIDFVDSIEKSFQAAKKSGKEKAFIIGGSQIFNQTLKRADEMILSRIPGAIDGDCKFPNVDTDIWKLSKCEEKEEFIVEYYMKRK